MAKLLANDPTFEGSVNDLRYPHQQDQQFAVDSSNALACGLKLHSLCGTRQGDIEVLFEARTHQLMQHRPHNVEDALY